MARSKKARAARKRTGKVVRRAADHLRTVSRYETIPSRAAGKETAKMRVAKKAYAGARKRHVAAGGKRGKSDAKQARRAAAAEGPRNPDWLGSGWGF